MMVSKAPFPCVCMHICTCMRKHQRKSLLGKVAELSPCVLMHMRMHTNFFCFMERPCAPSFSLQTHTLAYSYVQWWGFPRYVCSCPHHLETSGMLQVVHFWKTVCTHHLGCGCGIVFSSWLLQQLQQPIWVHPPPPPLLLVATTWKTPVPSCFGDTLEMQSKLSVLPTLYAYFQSSMQTFRHIFAVTWRHLLGVRIMCKYLHMHTDTSRRSFRQEGWLILCSIPPCAWISDFLY